MTESGDHVARHQSSGAQAWARLAWFWESPSAPNVALFVLTAAVFIRTASFGFTNFDDGQYVYENSWVKSGLSLPGLIWAFSALHSDVSYWHPLTWISHQLDCQLFGLRPGAHHMTNVWLHAGNTLLVFAILKRLGLGIRLAFLAAGIFGVHPLHVESVAWIAERKDVLYGCFWLSALYAYIRYRQALSRRWYAGSWLLFVCALMSKPAAVSLPVVLLLVELLNLKGQGMDDATKIQSSETAARQSWFKRIRPSVPFWALSAGIGVLTVIAQTEVGAVQTLGQLPLWDRMANALVSYAAYLRRAFLPLDLCASYVQTRPHSARSILLAACVLGALSWYSIMARRTRPLVLAGWLWYVLTLVPNIGIIQVGAQSMADRYMYLPLAGLLLMLAGLVQGLARPTVVRWLPEASGLLALACCATLSFGQLGYWRNGVALFSRATALNGENWVAQMGLGMALTEQGRFEEALPHLRCALTLPGNAAEAHKSLGIFFGFKGDQKRALDHFERAAQLARSQGRDKFVRDIEERLAREVRTATAEDHRGGGKPVDRSGSVERGALSVEH